MAEKLRLQEQRDAPGPGWEFVHPRCARKRRDDIEEVEAMVAAGEAEIARDELVWLLSECPDFLEAHLHLGLIALEDDDPKLARGHFGRAYELAGNKAFFEAAKGLVHCLVATGKLTVAEDIVRRTTTLDPTDPLALAALVAAARSQPRPAKRKERP
jgi:Flp pilus assembly protein TadD